MNKLFILLFLLVSTSAYARVASTDDVKEQLIMELNDASVFQSYELLENSVDIGLTENLVALVFYEGFGSLLNDEDYYELRANFTKDGMLYELNVLIRVKYHGTNEDGHHCYSVVNAYQHFGADFYLLDNEKFFQDRINDGDIDNYFSREWTTLEKLY